MAVHVTKTEFDRLAKKAGRQGLGPAEPAELAKKAGIKLPGQAADNSYSMSDEDLKKLCELWRQEEYLNTTLLALAIFAICALWVVGICLACRAI